MPCDGKLDRRTDAGQKQELRRAEGAAAKDDLALRLRHGLALARAVAHAGGALAVKDDAWWHARR